LKKSYLKLLEHNYFDKVCNQYERYISRNNSYSRDGSTYNRRYNSSKSLHFNQNDNNRIDNIEMHYSERNSKEQILFREPIYFVDDPTSIPKQTETVQFSQLNDVTEHQITSTPLNNSNAFFKDNVSKNNHEKSVVESNSNLNDIDEKCVENSPVSTDSNHVELKKDEKDVDSLIKVFPTPPPDEEHKKILKIETKNSVTHESIPPLENFDDTLKMESESSWIAMNKNYPIKKEEYTQTLTIQSAVTLNVDSRYQIYVTNVHSPLLFWVQLKDFERILSKLHSEIKYFNYSNRVFNRI
jgi:hypothetical protein